MFGWPLSGLTGRQQAFLLTPWTAAHFIPLAWSPHSTGMGHSFTRLKQERGVMMCRGEPKDDTGTWLEGSSCLSDRAFLPGVSQVWPVMMKVSLCSYARPCPTHAMFYIFSSSQCHALRDTSLDTKSGNPGRTPKKDLLFPKLQHLTAYWTFHCKPLAHQPV